MGYLTMEQMQRAAQHYRLGMARDGGVIFWQIDQLGNIYDGKVMYYREDCHRDHSRHPTWVSNELKRFYLGREADSICPSSTHCLFGTHLLGHTDFTDYTDGLRVGGGHTNFTDHTDGLRGGGGHTDFTDYKDGVTPNYEGKEKICDICVTNNHFRVTNTPVCVVEAEKTAVIMSEHFPQYLWLATGGLNELTPVKLFPLRGRKIIIFPDTDPDGKAYTLWYGIAQQAQRLLGQPVTVSPLLELKATAEQKRRKIDLVDFLFEGHTDTTDYTDGLRVGEGHTDFTDGTDGVRPNYEGKEKICEICDICVTNNHFHVTYMPTHANQESVKSVKSV